MIRGNETAIGLGLEIAAATLPRVPKSVKTIAVFCEVVRQELNLPTQPIRHQDIFFLEHRALRKMRSRSRCRTLDDFASRVNEDRL